MDDAESDRVMRIIRARCGDVLTSGIALLAHPVKKSNPPSEVMEAILAVLSALEARLEALQEGEDDRQRRSA